MSGNTTVPSSTASQPNFSSSNIAAHPGSTWAGIGMLAMAVGQTLATSGLPVGPAGWITFGTSILGGVLAMFGK